MRYKEARIKNTHEMRGQTKAQVENRSRETAASHKYVPTPAHLRRACHKYVPTPVIGLTVIAAKYSIAKSTHRF